MGQQGHAGAKMADDLKTQYDNAQENLEKFRKAVETAANELDFVPEESQVSAIRLIDIGKSQLSEFEKEWGILRQQHPTSEDNLGAFINRISSERGKLSILMERAIYRRNLGILENQLAAQQSALTKEQLETTLRPQMNFEIKKINALEAKKRLEIAEQQRMAIHKNNLKIYQEMLSGQRPYAPLHLVNSLAAQEQAIQDIDHRLANL